MTTWALVINRKVHFIHVKYHVEEDAGYQTRGTENEVVRVFVY